MAEPATPPSVELPAQKRGNHLGFWFFKTSLRAFGLRGAYGLLYFVCLYYLAFDRHAVRGAMAYIRRRFPDAAAARRLFLVYRLFISQGKNLIDRYYLISGAGNFEIRLVGWDKITDALADPKRGLILLTAHMGNWQVVMTALMRLGRSVCLLMRPEDNAAVQESLQISQEASRIKVVSPTGFLGNVVELIHSLNEGWIVSIMGDRSYDFSSTEIRFLGGTARFPHGAFVLAAATGCPVVVLLATKMSVDRYDLEVCGVLWPRYRAGIEKQAQLQGWAQEFAGMLEAFVERHPLECFLFQDIWSEGKP